MKSLLKRALNSVGLNVTRTHPAPEDDLLKVYREAGCIPWSRGYNRAKIKFIEEVLTSKPLMDTFCGAGSLPSRYGYGFDERCVEYPWLVSRLNHEQEEMLDAGSALNYRALIAAVKHRKKNLHILTLAPEADCYWRDSVSYLFADLRRIPIRDAYYDCISCLSTIEHVGLDNTMYIRQPEFKEACPEEAMLAMRELRRVLKPDGKLFLTVPYGVYRRYRSFQQYDQQLLTGLVDAFGSASAVLTYYRYTAEGWVLSTEAECSGSEYVEWVARAWDGSPWPDPLTPEPDYAAAARAVACVEIVRA